MNNTPIGPWERRVVTWITRRLWRPRQADPRPVPDWLPHSPFTIQSPDGATLAARWFPGTGAATVVLAHPDKRQGQDWLVQSGWVDTLQTWGLNVLTFDFVGYGQSPHAGDNYFHEHLASAIREARRRSPQGRLHVAGVSLGAFVAANASAYMEIDCLILESPYPTFASWYAPESRMRRILLWFERWFPKSSRRVNAVQSLALTKAARILVVGSTSDDVTPLPLTEQVADAAPSGRTKLLRLADVEHLGAIGSPAFRKAVRSLLVTTPHHERGGARGNAHRPVQGRRSGTRGKRRRMLCGTAPAPRARANAAWRRAEGTAI